MSVGAFAFGVTVRPNLRIGVEAIGDQWYARDAAGTRLANVIAANVSATVYFFPIRRSDLFLKVGQGVSLLVIDEYTGIVAGRRNSFGTGFTAGIGYEVPLLRSTALSVQVTGASAHPGSANGIAGNHGWDQWMTAATIGITVHAPGRRRPA